MVQEQIKTLPVKEAFSKWFIDDVGLNNIPPQYSWYIRNARISNKSTTIRPWRTTLLSNPYPWYIQGMTYNNGLLFNANGSLCNLWWILWPISANNDVNYITYGKYTIILTGIGNPRVRNGVWVPVQISDTFMPFDNDVSTDFNCPLKPIIGTAFTGFTMFAGNIPWYDNIMYISKPIIRDKTTNWFTLPYNRTIPILSTSDAAEYRVFRSKILWMIANYNNLYVFCEDSIETLWQWNATTVGGIVTLFTQPIWDGDRLASPRVCVSVWNKIFYITKSRSIKTINFIPWIADPEIGDLTDIPWTSIRGFMDRELNIDQSKASAVYVKKDNTVRFYLRGRNSSFENNICLIYDLENQTFLVDDGKTFSISVQGDNDIVYAGDMLNTNIYQDDNGLNDSWAGIIFEYDTPNYWMGSPNFIKQFRGYTIAGGINTTTTIQIKTYIDWVLLDTQNITSANININELNTVNIWWVPFAPWPNVLYPFTFTIDHWQIRQNGKKIRIQILESGTNPWFYFDLLSFIVRPKGRYELNDVL